MTRRSGKLDFEMHVKLGKPIPKIAFGDLHAAKGYFVPGLKRAKEIIRARSEKMERDRHFFNCFETLITEKCLDLSLATAWMLKKLRHLIRDMEVADPEARAQARRFAQIFGNLEARAKATLNKLRFVLVFYIWIRLLVFILLFYLLFLLPASAQLLAKPSASFRSLMLRALPLFLLGVLWEVNGEFIKPMQSSLRESQTAVQRIRCTCAGMIEVIADVDKLLEPEPETALDSLV